MALRLLVICKIGSQGRGIARSRDSEYNKFLNTQEYRFPIHFLIKRIHDFCGIVPLFLFLVLVLNHVCLVLFSDSETMASFISFQKTPLFIFFDTVFILIPLIFHFSYSLLQIYNSRVNVHLYNTFSNWRSVLNTVAAIVGLIFIVYHLGQLYAVYFNNLAGHHYIQTILAAHQGLATILLFWVGIFVLTYYFFNYLWHFLINMGLTTQTKTQTVSLRIWMILMLGVMGFEVMLLIKAVVERPTL